LGEAKETGKIRQQIIWELKGGKKKRPTEKKGTCFNRFDTKGNWGGWKKIQWGNRKNIGGKHKKNDKSYKRKKGVEENKTWEKGN